MRASTTCLIMLSAAASLVSSRPSASYLTHTFRTLSSASYKRQSSGTIPSQCASTCDPVNNEVNSGCPITACCAQSFETSYYNCLLCVGTAMNATDYTQAQADLDTLYVSCYDYGYTLQELTFPGQNPSRTLSTSLIVGSSATATSASKASTVQPSTTSPASSGTATSHASSGTATSPSSSGTATSPTSSSTAPSSTPTSAAPRLGASGSGVWVLAAAAVGLVVL